jgi:formylmethanofuran dehydrogenase subunit A
MEEIKERLLKSDELDDIMGETKPRQMDTESVMEVLKGNKFTFSLDGEHYSDYLIEARVIAEKILKRAHVKIERGLITIKDHLSKVSEPQYKSVFLMRLFQVALE